MIPNPFNFPSVDHLVEGRDYRIVEWSFADNAPVEKQKPEPTVQPNQQNAPAPQAPAPAAASAPAPAAAAPPQGQAPAAAAGQPPQQTGPCQPDEKMVFGVCRKTGGQPQNEKDFDPASKTEEEKSIEAEAKKQGSDSKNNKPVMVNGKKYGWAIKGGKPVMVEWGAVAGEKKVEPKQPPAVQGASGGPQPLSGKAGNKPPATVEPKPPKPGQQPQAPQSDPAAKIAELQQAMNVPGLPPAAQKALQNAIDLMGG